MFRKLSELRPLRLDTVAAIGGIIIGVVLLPLRFLASQIYLETVPIVLLVGCSLYLLALVQGQSTTTIPALPSSVSMALPSIVLVSLAALVVLSAMQGERTVEFFVLASAVATVVFCQIVFTSDQDFDHRVVLFQLVALAFVFRFTALYATPGYIGIDAWTHMTELADAIHESNSLSAINYDKHYASPFYHLLVVGSSLLYDTSLRTALFLSVGIVMPLSVLLVYAGANLLVPSRWATLATALFAVSNHVSHWGMHLIPTSMGLVFFLALLYALIRVMRIEYTLRDFVLLLLCIVAVVLTHQVSTFIVIMLLLAAFIAQVIFEVGPLGLTRLDPSVFRTKEPVNLIGLVVFTFGFSIFVWSLTPMRGDTFLRTVTDWFEQTLNESLGFLNIASGASDADTGMEAGPEATSMLSQIVPYIDVLGFLILLSLTFVGSLYVVHRRHAEQSVFTLLLAAAVMLVFVLVLPMFGIRNFIPGRWFAFLFVPMAILGAIGLRVLARDLNPQIVVVCLLLVVLIYPGAMFLSAQSSPDNPVFPNQHEQLAYDETEIAAAETIAEMTGSPTRDDIAPGQELYSDHPYRTMIDRKLAYPSEVATVVDDEPADHDYTAYRTSQSTDATYFYDENGVGEIRNIPMNQLCRPTQSLLYDNGDVRFCGPSPSTG